MAATCQRFNQNYAFGIDPKSPIQKGAKEWARIEDAYLVDRLFTRSRKLDATDEESCFLACEAAQTPGEIGCLGALWSANSGLTCTGRFVPSAQEFDVEFVKGTSSIALMTCNELVQAERRWPVGVADPSPT